MTVENTITENINNEDLFEIIKIKQLIFCMYKNTVKSLNDTVYKFSSVTHSIVCIDGQQIQDSITKYLHAFCVT